MSLKFDLPALSNSGQQGILLDADYGFYEAQKEGNAYVYVEKYAVQKSSYRELPKGTRSTNRPNAYMVKQTNYSDIGGGMVTFERHFAVLPDPWYDYEVVTIRLNISAGVADSTYAVNPPDGSGISFPVLAKVTRTYYLETLIPELTLQDPYSTYTESGDFEATLLTGVKIKADEVGIYMGNIYEVITYNGAAGGV